MSNAFADLIAVLPQERRHVGQVIDVANGVATIELPGGGILRARGTAAVGNYVFVRGGSIESVTQAYAVVPIEI